jgi:hypothetical protein
MLKLPDAVGNSLHATHFVSRLKSCRNDNASARSHLPNIRRQHLQAMSRISQRSNNAGKNM